MAPSAYVDLMSYCNPAWVSDYNYKKVQTYLEHNPPSANVPPGPPQPMIVVSGTLSGGSLSLRPVQRLRNLLGLPTLKELLE